MGKRTTEEQVENAFTYHRPFGDQPLRYERIRAQARELAVTIIQSTPPSREQALAMTNLEQAIMWANAAIARNEKPEPAPVVAPALGVATPEEPAKLENDALGG